MIGECRLDFPMIKTLCNTIFRIWNVKARLPYTLWSLYLVQSAPEETKWDGRASDYMFLINFLNRTPWEEKHKALCDAMEKMEKELEKNIYTEAEYMEFCKEIQECSQMMKRVEEIVDIFECYFVPDSSPSGKHLRLKYQDHYHYEPNGTRQVVWVSPNGRVIFEDEIPHPPIV